MCDAILTIRTLLDMIQIAFGQAISTGENGISGKGGHCLS